MGGRRERRKQSGDVDIPDDGVPYDRGWAWVISLAGFMNLAIASGYSRATYLFFVEFLERFQASVTETALLFGVKSATNSLVGLFVMNAVVGRLGVRKTVFVSAICISLSAILGSFANDITSLIFCQSLFHGLGMAGLTMPTTVLLGYYFRRRRSLANSLTKCGVGVGAVAFPPITTWLLHNYGLRGALLLIGGLCLNSLVAAMLLRPVSLYTKRRQALGECSSRLLPASHDSKTNNDDNDNDDDDDQDDNSKAKLESLSKNHSGNNVIVNDEKDDVKTTNNTSVLDKVRTTDDPVVGEMDFIANKDKSDRDPYKRVATSNSRNKNESVFGTRADSKESVSGQNGCAVVIEQEVRTLSCCGQQPEVRTFSIFGSQRQEVNSTSCSGQKKAAALAVLPPSAVSGYLTDGMSRSVPDVSAAACRLQDRSRRRTSSMCDASNGTSGPTRHAPIRHRSIISDHVLDVLNQSSVVRYMSAPDLELETPCDVTPRDTKPTETNPDADQQPSGGGGGRQQGWCRRVWGCMGAVVGVLDFRLFRSPMFRLLALYFFTSPLTQAVTTYLPAMAHERGQGQHAALLLSIIGGLDFVCRLSCGFLADLKIVKVSTMMGVAFIIVGVVCQLTRLFTTFPTLVCLAVTQGMFGGVSACMMPIIIMENVGLEHAAKALGFQKLMAGAAMAIAHPFLGFLRDVTGSYDVSYHVMGAFTLLSSVIILSLHLLPHRISAKGSEKSSSDNVL